MKSMQDKWLEGGEKMEVAEERGKSYRQAEWRIFFLGEELNELDRRGKNRKRRGSTKEIGQRERYINLLTHTYLSHNSRSFPVLAEI
jgi:hypothetical protein